MIIYSINPLFTAIVAYFALKEKITSSLIISFILSFLGLFFLIKDSLHLKSENFRGEISALISALFFSIYIVSSKKARQKLSNWHFAIGIYFVSSLFFLALSFAKQTPLIGYSKTSFFAIISIIAIPTLLGHASFTYLMKYLNINWMSCGKLIEPVFSSLIAQIAFQEEILPKNYIAFLFTSIAMIILFFPHLVKNTKNNQE